MVVVVLDVVVAAALIDVVAVVVVVVVVVVVIILVVVVHLVREFVPFPERAAELHASCYILDRRRQARLNVAAAFGARDGEERLVAPGLDDLVELALRVRVRFGLQVFL